MARGIYASGPPSARPKIFQGLRSTTATRATRRTELHINGERLGDTWPLGPDRLAASVSGEGLKKLREVNEVTVAWLGAEPLTRSRKPLDESQLP